MAYTYDDTREAPEALRLAVFAACTADEFAAANARFLILTGGPPHPFWNLPGGMGPRFYTNDCKGRAEYESTRLCIDLSK